MLAEVAQPFFGCCFCLQFWSEVFDGAVLSTFQDRPASDGSLARGDVQNTAAGVGCGSF